MELTERLERRGAADDMVWKWCENVISEAMKTKKEVILVSYCYSSIKVCHL